MENISKKQLEKVTKIYKGIDKNAKKSAKIVLAEIIQANKDNERIMQDSYNLTTKLFITNDQKTTLLNLAKNDFLIDELSQKLENDLQKDINDNTKIVTNKLISKCVLNCIVGNYSLKDRNKVSKTYGYDDDAYKFMHFFRCLGWALLGDKTIDIAPRTKKVVVKDTTNGNITTR